MLKKIFAVTAVLFFILSSGFNTAIAQETIPDCIQLEEKVSGDMTKYSLHGEGNGPVFFTGISCAIKHRNKELCAMEMISFDTTSKVYDYNTVKELEIGKAYFWYDEKNSDAPVLAFESKEDAEKYKAEKESGAVLDYGSLTDKLLD